jgi:large subunit ribosomal protein L21
MYAVIETGGKQYRVMQGDVLYVEKLGLEADSEVTFSKVLAVGKEDGVVVGAPLVDGAKVTAKVLAEGKGKKITVFHFRKKKNSKRKMGHRQPYSKVQIETITA